MKITGLEPQKKRPGRVNVFVDDQFSFGISEKLLIDFDLFKGKELTASEIEAIKGGENISKAMDKAYYFLSFRPRSEKEMRDKLGEKFEPEVVDAAIKKLKEYNFINDADFARIWVNSRASGRSAKALSFELGKKGIQKDVIEKALRPIDKGAEFESALNLVRTKSKYQNLDKNEAYKKIGGFLSRRGYNYEVIKSVITEILEN